MQYTPLQLRPVHKELYETVRRTDVVQAIERFLVVLQEAKTCGKILSIQGD